MPKRTLRAPATARLRAPAEWTRLPTRSFDSQRLFAATAIVGFALCVMTYFHAHDLAAVQRDTRKTFLASERDVRFPPFPSRLGLMDVRSNWMGRVLSIRFAHAFARASYSERMVDIETFCQGVGFYVAFWMGATFLACLMALEESALLAILGIFAGVSFGYTNGISDRIYPWDMPALFFFALFVCLLARGRQDWFLPILPVAVLFKETALLLPFAYLLGPRPLKRRLATFAIAAILAAAARLVATRWAGTTEGVLLNWKIPLANLRYFFTGEFPEPGWYQYPLRWQIHPILANAGLCVAFLLVKSDDPNMPALRCVFWLFTLMTFLFGIILEFRIWFELIPICLYPLWTRLAPAPVAAPVPHDAPR
jgi:hypothetical protein